MTGEIIVNGAAIPLASARVLIGRGEGCDILLPEDDLGVSRRHALLEWTEDRGWSVVDVSSRNGTLVNGQVIAERRALSDGDRIDIGRSVIRLSLPRSRPTLFVPAAAPDAPPHDFGIAAAPVHSPPVPAPPRLERDTPHVLPAPAIVAGPAYGARGDEPAPGRPLANDLPRVQAVPIRAQIAPAEARPPAYAPVCGGCGAPAPGPSSLCDRCAAAMAAQPVYENVAAPQGMVQGSPVVYRPAAPAEPYPSTLPPARPPAFYKNPAIAVLLSFFWTGLGQCYNGEVGKGLMLIVVRIIMIPFLFIPFVNFLVIAGSLFLWGWGMYDAHGSAERINREIASRQA
ncbi:MAG TPA: FHA domain-containing protein [Chthonomonadaceae bacterium]|nr:FHA domain-containing protein [Chthonomonadaceae bacterium]